MRLFVAALVFAAPVFGQITCSFTVTPTAFTIGNQAFTGTDSISVTPTGGIFCNNWIASVAPGVTWLHITSGSQGLGAGTVSWTADPNPVAADRRGIMTVALATVVVTQSANVCNFSVFPNSASYPVTGGAGSFQTTANCSWQAVSSDSSWIHVPGGTSTTSGTVTYTIGPNGCVSGRSGLITIQTGLANPPAVAIRQDGSPANLTLSAPGATASSSASDGRVLVSTGNGCGWTAISDVSWLQVTASAGSGNGGIAYHILANSLAPRTGNIHVTPAGTVGGLLFTVTQTAAGPPAPVATAVGNAASYAASAISPGEIVTIFGSNMGPASLTLYQLAGATFPASIAGTQVLFDGIAAPMIYTSQGQVSAMAPYGLAGKNSTNVQVRYQGVVSAAMAMPVQPATPGIFSLDASGLGPGAILNQDSSINSGPNPAAQGSVVSIYCTGGGLTNPATVDGSITASTPPLPILTQNVSVTIGGLPAKVDYSGGSPESVAGLVQINAEVPSGVTPGSTVPVVVQIGTARSQAGITMAVR